MSDKNLGTFKFTIAQGIQKPTKFNESGTIFIYLRIIIRAGKKTDVETLVKVELPNGISSTVVLLSAIQILGLKFKNANYSIEGTKVLKTKSSFFKKKKLTAFFILPFVTSIFFEWSYRFSHFLHWISLVSFDISL